MDQAELQKQIALYFSKLPKEAQEVIAKMEWLETLKTISEKYALGPEQIQTLGTETSLVLLGVIHAEEYEEIIKTKMGLPEEQRDQMLLEINDAVLKNIRPQLLDTFTKNVEEAEAAAKKPEVEEKLDGRFDKLPEEIRKVIIESGYHSKLYLIGSINKLSVPQMGALEEVTTGVIVGAIHPGQYEGRLKEELSVSSDTARKLAEEINEQILRPIHEKMEVVFPEAPTTLDVGVPTSLDQSVGKVNPVSAQKLGGPVQSGEVKTDYSLENISKASSDTKNVPANPKYSIDPYRETPE